MRPGYLIRITFTQKWTRSTVIAKQPIFAAATLLALGFWGLIPRRTFCFRDESEKIQNLLKKYKLPWAEIYAEELPRQQKQVTAFYIDRYEVTNSQYDQLC